MQKDVIYIDVEDDITAIIGKVKAAKHKIVALVPPKRVGILQSAVNLRLINRAATQKDKRLVIITGNQALSSLAAAAAIPVAKTLQSKPELAPIDAVEVDDGEDLINGSDLPVGEHAKQAESSDEDDVSAAKVAVAGIDKATPPAEGEVAKPKVKRGPVVPNFNTFRKKIVLIVAAVVLLISFLVWAIVFAPKAKVVVLMRTTDIAVSQPVNLIAGTKTAVSSNVIEAEIQNTTTDLSIEFDATGEKNVGEKATGKLKLTRNSPSSTAIPAGTSFSSSSGSTYVTTVAVTIPRSTAFTEDPSCFPTCPGTVNVDIAATGPGANFNGATGSMSSPTVPSGVSASVVGSTSGGTDRVVKVATESDIDAARNKAVDSINSRAALDELKTKFGDGFIVLESSLQVDSGDLKSSVAADAEASGGKATYGGKVKFALYGVAKSELESYLKGVLKQQIDNPDRQKVYDAGVSSVNFTEVDKADSGVRAILSTNGKIGPTIEEDEVKELSAGNRIGDIQAAIEKINGVKSVEVDLSPFWVTSAPKNTDKIRVEFQLDE